MSSVSEEIVKEYFEQLGFLVIQPCKYMTSGRAKRPEEDLDLLALNPHVTQPRIPDTLLWTGTDLKHIAGAVVGVFAWHSERLYPALMEQQHYDLLRFASDESARFAARRLGTQNVAKILCMPQLPASETLRADTLRILKEKGIDGVLSFRTMLSELINSVDTNRNYEKSDILQLLRILKNYDLVKTPQLDFFSTRFRRHVAKPSIDNPLELSTPPAAEPAEEKPDSPTESVQADAKPTAPAPAEPAEQSTP